MPSYLELLEKTKKKSEQVKNIRKSPTIAIDDRPYSSPQTPLNQPTKSDNKPATKRQQTDNTSKIKSTTNRQQTDNRITDNKPATNQQQSGNKPTTVALSMLVGLQRDIIILICNECKKSPSRTTEALTLEYMAASLKRSAGSIKTTIQRLEKKGCLVRVAFKNGRGGWSQYELPDSIYHDGLRIKSDNKAITK